MARMVVALCSFRGGQQTSTLLTSTVLFENGKEKETEEEDFRGNTRRKTAFLKIGEKSAEESSDK